MPTLLDDPKAVPVLPGSTYFFEAEEAVTTPASIGQTVFVQGTHNWGPVNEAIQYGSISEFFNGKAGDDTKPGYGNADTELRRNVLGAFLGEGLPGKGGASSVIVYRLAHSDAAPAEHVLQNTTPADALTVTAKHPGTRGNTFALTVRAAATVGNKELVVIVDGREAEVFEHAQADITGLAATINASSAYVTAVSTINGVALANVVAAALAGGDDGDDTVVIGDWTDMLDAIEFEPFSIFNAAGLTDAPTVAALLAWKDDLKANGKPIRLALGGPAAETFADHKTRAQGYDDDDVVALGTGDITDTALSADGSAVTYSTAEWVSRMAGAMARRGPQMDLVNVRFAGVTATVAGATRSQAIIAGTPGVGMTVMTRDGDREAPFKVALGVTSYTGDTAAKPRWVYSNAKFVATNHALVLALTEDQEHGDLIGELGVTERAADLVLGRAQDIVKDFIRLGIVQPGSLVQFDPEVDRTETDDFVPLAYDLVYVRGMRAIRNRIRIS